MLGEASIREGQLFNEPMLVETVRANVPPKLQGGSKAMTNVDQP